MKVAAIEKNKKLLAINTGYSTNVELALVKKYSNRLIPGK
jgi:hypothetical protein